MGTFQLKTRIFSGSGALEHLNDFSIGKALIVTDRYFADSGAAKRVADQLQAQTMIFDAVKPDPTLEQAAMGERLRADFDADTLIALGGGSPMDCAKGIKALSEKDLQLICIPTTSGSGSEVTSFAILTKGETKLPLVDDALTPDIAILDPSFQTSMPKHLIAETGMDLISHCLEALAAKNHNTFSDAMALTALETAVQFLPESYRGNSAVRGHLQEAACMAGAAFESAGLGIGHALSHALGARFHVSHGRLNTVLLPAVMQFYGCSCYVQAAKRLGCSGGTDALLLRSLLRKLEQLRKSLQLSGSLQELGITLPNDLTAIINDAMHDLCISGNPRPVSEKDLAELLRQVQ